MEQLNFGVGSTLGTVLFQFLTAAGWRKEGWGAGQEAAGGGVGPHKKDFTGVCNSVLAERSPGYAMLTVVAVERRCCYVYKGKGAEHPCTKNKQCVVYILTVVCCSCCALI